MSCWIQHRHKHIILGAGLRLRLARAETNRLRDGFFDIRHLKIKVNLLLLAVRLLRPDGRYIVLLLRKEEDKPGLLISDGYP